MLNIETWFWHSILTLDFDAWFWRLILMLDFDAWFWRLNLMLDWNEIALRMHERTDNANSRVTLRLKIPLGQNLHRGLFQIFNTDNHSLSNCRIFWVPSGIHRFKEKVVMVRHTDRISKKVYRKIQSVILCCQDVPNLVPWCCQNVFWERSSVSISTMDSESCHVLWWC